MLHRSLEAETTERVLAKIFADRERFVVHSPLPSHATFSDEGAANHLRLQTSRGAAHLFAWGQSPAATTRPARFPARQTRAASEAVARRHELHTLKLLPQQSPFGIDAGAFHSDVLAVSAGPLLLVHEHAFLELDSVLSALRERLGDELVVRVVQNSELDVTEAVRAYPFNSELVPLPDGSFALLAPAESQAAPAVRELLSALPAECPVVSRVLFVDVNDSMRNGGGPACLRLRVSLTPAEAESVSANVFFDAELDRALTSWVERHYRDRLSPADLADPALLTETRSALDELSALLGLGAIYDFQR
jgi:succinylarginine dihydrolase